MNRAYLALIARIEVELLEIQKFNYFLENINTGK